MIVLARHDRRSGRSAPSLVQNGRKRMYHEKLSSGNPLSPFIWSSSIFFQENASVRAAAIHLFGNLSRFGHGPSENSFLEQIHTNFVSILLHLNEETIVTKVREWHSCNLETGSRMRGCHKSSPNKYYCFELVSFGNSFERVKESCSFSEAIGKIRRNAMVSEPTSGIKIKRNLLY